MDVSTTITLNEKTEVILPPPDLKPIIETTAQYVSKKGPGLEKQIAQRQSNNPKFDFLKSNNPFHAFYRKQVYLILKDLDEKSKETIEEKEKTDNNIKKPEPDTKQEKKSKNDIQILEGNKIVLKESKLDPKKSSLLDRLKEIVRENTKPKEKYVKENQDFSFNLIPPHDIVALDVEIIKLTAQFVAANGRSFLATVSNREQKNPQFSFLKPTNAKLFLFFSDLVQAYQRILSPPEGVIVGIKNTLKYKRMVFDQLIGIAEHTRRSKERNELLKKSKEEEKREMALIDWHSFVILETIDFKPGDDEYLPPPSMTVDEINEHLEMEKRLDENIRKVGSIIPEEPVGEQMESSEEDVQMMDIDEDEQKKQKPSEQKTTNKLTNQANEEVQRCSVCGKNIRVSQIQEHIRIELLDPKWSEQRKIAQSKMRDSTLAEPLEMTRNLKNFVQVRKRPFSDLKKQPEIPWSSVSSTDSQINVPMSINAQQSDQNKNLLEIEKNQRERAVESALVLAHAKPSSVLRESLRKKDDLSQKEIPKSYQIPQTSKISQIIQNPVQMTNKIPQNPNVNLKTPQLVPPSQIIPPFPQPVQIPSQMNLNNQLQNPSKNFPIPGPSIPPTQVPLPQKEIAPIQQVLKHQRGPLTNQQMTGFGSNKNKLIPEAEFLSIRPKQVTLTVQVPLDKSKSSYNFNGQTFAIQMNLKDTVSSLKLELEKRLKGAPAKKLKLKIIGGTFLKDNFSLAFYNLTNKTPLEVGIKARGGRR